MWRCVPRPNMMYVRGLQLHHNNHIMLMGRASVMMESFNTAKTKQKQQKIQNYECVSCACV